MYSYVVIFLLLLLPLATDVKGQPSPDAMRLDYMVKQIDDTNTPSLTRIEWADSVIRTAKRIDDHSKASDALMKKAAIAYDAALYRKALNAYLEWINDYGGNADTDTRLKAFDRTAELYYYMGWYELSIRLSFDIIKNDKPAPLKYLDVYSYQRMAHCYIRMHDITHAKKYTAIADSCLALINITDTPLKNKASFDMSLLKAGMDIINGNYRNTYVHLEEAKKYASGVRDSIAILGDQAIVYEAIGDLNISRQCYESILNLNDISYQSMVCINNYIYFLTGQKDYTKAHEICAISYRMLDAMELDHSKSNLLDLESDIYMYENDFKNAYTALKKSKEINDTIFTPDHLSYIYGLNNLTDKHNLSVALAGEKRRNKIIRIASIILLLIASVAVTMWLLNSKRLKKVLENSRTTSSTLKASLEQKEDAIQALNEQIDRKNREIETYASIVGDDDMFQAKFNNIYCKLAPNLKLRHDNLTKAEINMAVFILLGIPTKDIADQQHLSVRTIENTKYRLYKKLGIAAADVPDYLRDFI